uniref:ZP domain-containing protein n=1 Tax=Panagrolaimus sp. ES5 TaxID=591445 RepID=A0AC34FXK7_9BILA
MIDTLAYVKYGESYFLKVSLENVEYARRFRITDCIAESEGLVAELIDPNGCSINDETKNFNYEDGHATALIPSFFRFFNFKLLKIECKISLCDQSLGCQPRCDKFATNPIEIFNQTVFPAQINYFKIASLTMHVLDENSSNGEKNQKEFFNNFFRPFHNYRNTAFEANDCTNQKSRRSSLTRFADHIRRSSAPTPTLTPTPTFYLMEMTAVPQNFHPFKLSSILHNSDAESTNSVNETSSNNDQKNEIDKNETSTL